MRLIPLHALLPVGPNNEPPRDFTLIKAGTMSTVYGDFYWDAESAASVSRRWARRNRRFMWDYQHLSDKDGRIGPDGKPTPMASVHDRRSAGDAAPQADSQGFHLLGQFWPPDADGYIRRREYLYFSPVIAVDEKSEPPGRILDVLKSSLTNDPATLGCPQIVALSADAEEAAEQIEEMAGAPRSHRDRRAELRKAAQPETNAAQKMETAENMTQEQVGSAPHQASTEQAASTSASVAVPVPKPAADVTAQTISLTDPGEPHPHGNPATAEVSSVLVHRESDGHSLWGKRNDSGRHTSPGGRLRKGERPIDAAARELKEEAGIDKPSHEFAYMGTVRCADDAGRPIDVHGYRCSVPDHVRPTSERDPDREVGEWEYLAEHPLSTMHAPRNALSVLSARHEHLNFAKSDPAKGATEKGATEKDSAKASAGKAGREKQLNEKGAKMSTDNSGKTSNTATERTVGSTDNMDTQKARALTLSLLGGLPGLSGDGVSAEVATAAQSAMASLKKLDEALAASGATGDGIAVDSALSLAEVVKEVTGSKNLEGIIGKVYSLSERANVAPVAVELSETQAKTILLDKALRGGKISPKTHADMKTKVVRLSLADCQHLAAGPKLYDVPSTEVAPQGANSTQVSLSDVATAAKGSTDPLAASPPAGLPSKDGGKKVELSAQHEQLLRDVERNLPAGQKLSRDKVAEVIASTAQSRSASPELPKMRNPTA